MPKSADPNKKVLKRNTGDHITGVDVSSVDELQAIIDEMFELLERIGYKPIWPFDERNNPLEPFGGETSGHYFAGCAVLHAKCAQQAINDGDVPKVAYNAMRAVNYRWLAVIRSTDLEANIWAGSKSRRMAASGAVYNIANEQLRQRRSELVAELRKRGMKSRDIPRRLAQQERNLKSPAQVEKTYVDAMRKYLRRHGLI